MGILILAGSYNTAELFRNNEFFRFLFGGILVIYGFFRAYNVYVKIKLGNKRKLHYYNDDDD
jgi:hypothetical protein